MSNTTSAGSAQIQAKQSTAGIRATLNFIRPQQTKPVFQSAALTGGAPKLFFEVEPHTVTITEMRDVASTLSMDREGFRLLSYRSTVADLYDDAAIKQTYYPEIQALLRRELGASRVEQSTRDSPVQTVSTCS